MKIHRFLVIGGSILAVSQPSWAFQVRSIPLPTHDIAWDRSHSRFLAAMPSLGGTHPNRIAHVNKVSGAVVRSIFAGSDPDRLSFSTSGTKLHVGFQGSSSYRTLDLGSFSFGPSHWLPNPTTPSGPLFVGLMAAVPGSDTGVVIATRALGQVGHRYVGVFESGALLPRFSTFGPRTIGFGRRPGRLYALSDGSDYALARFDIDANGMTFVSETRGVEAAAQRILISGSSMFTSSGVRIDLESGATLGRYGGSGLPWADEALNRVALLTPLEGNRQRLSIYDANRYTLLGNTVIPGVFGTASSLIQSDANELAFRTDTGQVFFVTTGLVPEPGTLLVVGSGAAALVVRRRRNKHGLRAEEDRR